MQGRIVKQISNDYTVKVNSKEYVCKARGKFREMGISPLVGDFVNFDDKENYILEILPRKNELTRPRICNIDQAIIITSLKTPDFDTNLLDRLLAIITFNNIKPIIIFTKSDLCTEKELDDFQVYFDYYKKIGFDVYMNYDIDSISRIFNNKVSVFTGQSGAGKSTLLNNLDKNLNIKTGEVSLALNRGKHTTRHTELLEVCGGLVADTPGFSSLEFTDMSKSDIRDSMIEFNFYRNDCKYRDCMHDREDDCAVKKHLESLDILKSRYNNYISFIRE